MTKSELRKGPNISKKRLKTVRTWEAKKGVYAKIGKIEERDNNEQEHQGQIEKGQLKKGTVAVNYRKMKPAPEAVLILTEDVGQ